MSWFGRNDGSPGHRSGDGTLQDAPTPPGQGPDGHRRGACGCSRDDEAPGDTDREAS